MPKQQTIAVLTANCACLKGQEAALNGLSDEAVQGIADYVESLADHAGVINTLRTDLGLGDGITLNAMPAALKKKMKGAKCVDPPEPDEDDMTGNMSLTKWLSIMPEKAKPVWNSAVRAHDRDKAALVEQLVANWSGKEKEARAAKLGAKSIDELTELLDLFPVANAGRNTPAARPPSDYFGAGGASHRTGSAATANADLDAPAEPPLGLPDYSVPATA